MKKSQTPTRLLTILVMVLGFSLCFSLLIASVLQEEQRLERFRLGKRNWGLSSLTSGGNSSRAPSPISNFLNSLGKIIPFTPQPITLKRRARVSPTILCWTTYFDASLAKMLKTKTHDCPMREGKMRCKFTDNRSAIDSADAVLFHFPHYNPNDIPKRNNTSQLFVYFNQESPMHYVKSVPEGFFNLSMSYRLDSDVPVPYMYNAKFHFIPDKKGEDYLALKNKEKIAVTFISNCDDVGGGNFSDTITHPSPSSRKPIAYPTPSKSATTSAGRTSTYSEIASTTLNVRALAKPNAMPKSPNTTSTSRSKTVFAKTTLPKNSTELWSTKPFR